MADAKTPRADESKAGPSRYLDPEEVRVFRGPSGRVYATIGNEVTVIMARFVRVCPLTEPDHYLSILGSGPGAKEFGLLRDWRRLDPGSRQIVEAELQRRYLHPTVERILSVRDYSGFAVCVLQTNRGVRQIVLRDARDGATYLGSSRVLLTDVEGNRYDIKDIAGLDARSRSLLDRVL